MSLNAIAFLGSTPIGAPLLGYISDVSNPRVALVVGGVATLAASIPLFFLATRQRGGAGRVGSDAVVVADEDVQSWCRCPLADDRPRSVRRSV